MSANIKEKVDKGHSGFAHLWSPCCDRNPLLRYFTHWGPMQEQRILNWRHSPQTGATKFYSAGTC